MNDGFLRLPIRMIKNVFLLSDLLLNFKSVSTFHTLQEWPNLSSKQQEVFPSCSLPKTDVEGPYHPIIHQRNTAVISKRVGAGHFDAVALILTFLLKFFVRKQTARILTGRFCFKVKHKTIANSFDQQTVDLEIAKLKQFLCFFYFWLVQLFGLFIVDYLK